MVCWQKCPPWPIEQGKRGHYAYYQTKCLSEYMDCLAGNAAERLAEACANNPMACGVVILGAIVVASQRELGPILIPTLGTIGR
jgi:hypothetical protein